MNKAIIVTGTPGTGKTTFAKKLANLHSWRYVDVNKVVEKHNLSISYDSTRKTKVVDEKKLAKVLKKIIQESSEQLIIDSHLSHYIDPSVVKKCIVVKCAIPQLEKRLKNKGYSKAKVEENKECELLDICLHEAEDAGHKVKVVDASKRVDVGNI